VWVTLVNRLPATSSSTKHVNPTHAESSGTPRIEACCIDLPDLPLLFGHTYYDSGNLPGSADQGILGILFLNPTLQE